MNVFLSVKFLFGFRWADYYSVIDLFPSLFFVFVEPIIVVLLFFFPNRLQDPPRPDVNQAKDEFEDYLCCLVYHSTIGVFHQPVGRFFTS